MEQNVPSNCIGSLLGTSAEKWNNRKYSLQMSVFYDTMTDKELAFANKWRGFLAWRATAESCYDE